MRILSAGLRFAASALGASLQPQRAEGRLDMVSADVTLLAVLSLMPTAPDQKPLRSWFDVASPKKVHAPPVRYPPMAEAASISAAIVIEVTVDGEGRPSRVRPIRSHPLFDEEVKRAVRNWRYEPTLVDGTPRSVIVYEPFYFDLAGGPRAEDVSRWAEGQRAEWPGALEVKLWAVAYLPRLFATQRVQAAAALQKLAEDADERVSTAARAALAALPAAVP